MKTNHQQQPAKLENMDNMDNLDSDAVWELLEKAPTKQAGPMFSRNVMRAIRLEDLEENAADSAPWWKKIFAPKPALAFGAMGAAACGLLAITATLSTDPSSTSTTAEVKNPISLDADLAQELESLHQAQIDDEFLEELSVISSTDDSFFSAEEIASFSVNL